MMGWTGNAPDDAIVVVEFETRGCVRTWERL